MSRVADVLFDLEQGLASRPSKTAGLNATFEFRLSGEGGGIWHMLFKDGTPILHVGEAERADAVLSMLANEFVAMHTGILDGSEAFATGRLRVTGDLTLGMRFGQLIRQNDQTPVVTPEPIIRVASGFMGAKYLFAANELSVFEYLANGPLTLEELATRIGASPRSVRIIVDALVALKLLNRQDGRYVNHPSVSIYLSGRAPVDLRALLRSWDRISYPLWTGLATAVRTEGAVPLSLDREQQQDFTKGVNAITASSAWTLSGLYEFERHERILDVGGGMGGFLLAALSHRPTLRGTLLELPEVAALARQRLAVAPCFDRIDVVECDFFKDPIPTDHDAMLVANVVHIFSPAQNMEMFRRLRCSGDIGTRLLLVDTWTDDDRSAPLQAALLAGEYFLMNGGDVYSVGDVQRWLQETGWTFVDRHRLVGAGSLVIGEAQ
jgi:putative sterol carrier protein